MFSSRRAARSLSRPPPVGPFGGAGASLDDAGTGGEDHASLGDEVQVGPLVGEDEGIAHGEGGHAADAQRDAIRDTDQRAEQRERLGAAVTLHDLTGHTGDGPVHIGLVHHGDAVFVGHRCRAEGLLGACR